MSMAADVLAKVHSLQHSLDVANRTIAAQARANAETLEQCERIVEASRRACSLHTDAEEKWQQEVRDAHVLLAAERRRGADLERALAEARRTISDREAAVRRLTADIEALEDELAEERRALEEARATASAQQRATRDALDRRDDLARRTAVLESHLREVEERSTEAVRRAEETAAHRARSMAGTAIVQANQSLQETNATCDKLRVLNLSLREKLEEMVVSNGLLSRELDVAVRRRRDQEREAKSNAAIVSELAATRQIADTTRHELAVMSEKYRGALARISLLAARLGPGPIADYRAAQHSQLDVDRRAARAFEYTHTDRVGSSSTGTGTGVGTGAASFSLTQRASLSPERGRRLLTHRSVSPPPSTSRTPLSGGGQQWVYPPQEPVHHLEPRSLRRSSPVGHSPVPDVRLNMLSPGARGRQPSAASASTAAAVSAAASSRRLATAAAAAASVAAAAARSVSPPRAASLSPGPSGFRLSSAAAFDGHGGLVGGRSPMDVTSAARRPGRTPSPGRGVPAVDHGSSPSVDGSNSEEGSGDDGFGRRLRDDFAELLHTGPSVGLDALAATRADGGLGSGGAVDGLGSGSGDHPGPGMAAVAAASTRGLPHARTVAFHLPQDHGPGDDGLGAVHAGGAGRDGMAEGTSDSTRVAGQPGAHA